MRESALEARTGRGELRLKFADVFAEGLQLPPVRLYDAGRPVQDLHRLLALNSRTPDRVMGDVGALVAGVNVAAERVEALADRYGTPRLRAGIEAYLAGTEARMREELSRLAPGIYRGEYRIDGDGLEPDLGLGPLRAIGIHLRNEMRGARRIRRFQRLVPSTRRASA